MKKVQWIIVVLLLLIQLHIVPLLLLIVPVHSVLGVAN